MKIRTPKGWRKGQTLINFLRWLYHTKGYRADGSLADVFYVSDEELEALFEEFLKKNELQN